MKFSIAAAAIAATSSFVGVHASTSTAKSGKGSCSSSPKLEKFCYEEPANFEGTYHICYSNVVRSSATGILDGAIPLCPDGKGADVEVFTKLDEFGAYTKSLVSNNELLNAQFNYQGIAQGNSIKLTSFGGGWVNGEGVIILPNETPDTEECTVYDDGILKCMTYFVEYCGPNTANQTVLPSDCEVGEWLTTYTIDSVSVLEGFECPPAPAGFCDNYVPGRKLQEEEEKEEEDNEAIPCPFLNEKMN